MSQFEALKALEYDGKDPMITAVVQFKLPKPATREEAKQMFLSTAPRFREVQGLVRKYYVLSLDGESGGGVYLWQSREDADRVYTDEWKALVRERYGSEPTIQYFHSPVIVDNSVGDILQCD